LAKDWNKEEMSLRRIIGKKRTHFEITEEIFFAFVSAVVLAR
jgi:hypothetical protein